MKVALLMLAAAAAQPTDQRFNLVCTGTIHSFFENSGTVKDEPYSYTYRIDLNAGKWCQDAPAGTQVASCAVVRPIAEVQPGFLRLEADRNETAPTHREKWTSLIDRMTGAETTMVESWDDLLGNSTMTWTGTCEKQPFTGFPAVETKF